MKQTSPKTKKPTKIRKAEPKPALTDTAQTQPGPANSEPPNLTSLLINAFQFDADADNESRQLLSNIFDRFQKTTEHPFSVVAAASALHAIGVHVSLETLEEPAFVDLLNLFCGAVSGYGYGGFREEIISLLLNDTDKELTFERMLAHLSIGFQQKNSNLAVARQALKEYPEELADAIRKASSRSI